VSDDLHFGELVALCARLRAPDGCPWDRQQTLESLRAYIVEEAYEVVDAIPAGEPALLAGELGDLLFQIIFVAQIAGEKGWFTVADVCRGIHAKMVRRHPHVFGEVEVSGASEVVRNWEAIKQREKGQQGALAGVPRQLPALLKALRMTEKAAAVGFDWQRVDDVVAKLEEEVGELSRELRQPAGERRDDRVRAELGDVLFVIANLARQLRVDAEAALQTANEKFARRFGAMEARAAERGGSLGSLTLAELDALWDEVKAGETTAAGDGDAPVS
jgi:tetrapyrrole methylase family protein/MazG family protein